MEIIISNSSGIPIYEQIKEQIKAKIISNELKVNELLPSIRSLAKDLRCSVITTKNAYEELVHEGYVINVPSKGFYVAEINDEVVREELLNKIELLLENEYTDVKIIEVLTTMKNNPLTLEQAEKSLEKYHKEHSV